MSEIFNVNLDNLILGISDAQNKIDERQFVYDPLKGVYVRRYGQMNFWDFLAHY